MTAITYFYLVYSSSCNVVMCSSMRSAHTIILSFSLIFAVLIIISFFVIYVYFFIVQALSNAMLHYSFYFVAFTWMKFVLLYFRSHFFYYHYYEYDNYTLICLLITEVIMKMMVSVHVMPVIMTMAPSK